MEELVQFQLSKEFLERFKDAIDKQDEIFIKSALENAKPADVASLFDEIDSDDSKFVIGLLGTEAAAEVLNDLDPDFRQRFLKKFTAEEIAEYVNYLDSDDAVDILNEIPIKKREEVIANLESEEQAAYILDLLRYEEDCAGGLMAKELIKANVNWTVVQCIDEIRRQAEDISKMYSVYVVDNQQKLLGRVSLKRIILSDDNTKIADIYDDDIVSVTTYMHEEEVAEIMRKYDLEAVPVVNVQGKLVGRITVDDIIDVITKMAEEERQLMSGISENVEEDDSIWVLSRARLPWLSIGAVGGLFGAQFIGLFEGEIAAIPALAFFIPIITATGGNVGIQSSSIVLQSLANRSVFEDSTAKRLLKVTAVAVLNGIVLAALVFTANIALGESKKLGLVVSIALFSVVLLASVMGTITPLILDKLKINPALASGPFITTANDLLGLGVYFSVAHLLYNL